MGAAAGFIDTEKWLENALLICFGNSKTMIFYPDQMIFLIFTDGNANSAALSVIANCIFSKIKKHTID